VQIQFSRAGLASAPVHNRVGRLADLGVAKEIQMDVLSSRIKARLSDKPRAKANKRVLLIDDEPNSAVPRVFARKQCHVVHCDCVRKAWNCVYPRRPDVIVFRLRHCDEKTLADLHECRALAGSVPIVIATALSLEGDLLKMLSRWAAVIADRSEASIATETLRRLQFWTLSH
jgi:DNA-binding Lrp family transcriptional regulator